MSNYVGGGERNNKNKNKRAAISLQKKIDIFNSLANGYDSKTVAETFYIHPSTVCVIKKNEKKYSDLHAKGINENIEKYRVSKAPLIEEAIFNWFLNASAILKAKANNFAELNQMSDFNATDGWVSRTNAWMSSSIFIDWLSQWDKNLVKSNRKIALFLDNAPCHPQIDSLKNIKLVFLPSKTNSILQPLDQGILNALKTNYRSRVLNQLVLFMDKKQDWTIQDWLKNWDLWKALNVLSQSWDQITMSTIVNCWRKAGFIVSDCPEDPQQEAKKITSLLDDKEFKEFVNLDEKNYIFWANAI
ncbi:unnamed protein product [Brachionus calyciflorus]|uniref:DDE-1 domain-containing protein n=1 Tax=Brachionus calyciflorus TaxID=104777 RepID=A0A814L2M1_9BILA|nr:unnamed protein product [Brachionus calyciflorus]